MDEKIKYILKIGIFVLLVLAVINILQIAKEHKVKTKYDEQINEQL